MMPPVTTNQEVAELARGIVAWLPFWLIMGIAAVTSIAVAAGTSFVVLVRKMRNVWTG